MTAISAFWERDIDTDMWPLELRMRLRDKWGVDLVPCSMGTQDFHTYILGWCVFKSKGETCVEFLKSHMEASTDPELFDAAWQFLVKLQLENRVIYKQSA